MKMKKKKKEGRRRRGRRRIVLQATDLFTLAATAASNHI
jgi:hypothetical protein